jgi:23S rRNA (uracil1939-C5)-methyltransferase
VIVDYLREAVLQRERPDLVVLDPPRAGAGVEVCRLIAQIAPHQIVYVSCDPVTLGRDLATLQSNYEIESLHLVDLFPQTYHQEAVVKLRRHP